MGLSLKGRVWGGVYACKVLSRCVKSFRSYTRSNVAQNLDFLKVDSSSSSCSYQCASSIRTHPGQGIHHLCEMLEERHKFHLKAFRVNVANRRHPQMHFHIIFTQVLPVRRAIPKEIER